MYNKTTKKKKERKPNLIIHHFDVVSYIFENKDTLI